MRGIDFGEARARLRIAEVRALMDYQPRQRRGPHTRGPCPLHGSRTPASRVFAVHEDKNVFHCFGCGASGNALDLWAAWTRQDVYAAVLDLFGRLGRNLPWRATAARPRRSTMPGS
jgi:DNA primase